MVLSIRENPNINGFKIDSEEIKLGRFADDTTIFLNDLEFAKITLDIINDFEKISGLKLNMEKTEAMWLGSLKDSVDKPFGLKWSQAIKSLGIYFSYDKDKAEKINFGHCIESMQKVINSWYQRNLSLYGKVTVLKSLICSKLVYIASKRIVPDHIIKQINQMILNFYGKVLTKLKEMTMIGEESK